jgi:UDP-3-O-acyl N-acetylglucosamine deacetylase
VTGRRTLRGPTRQIAGVGLHSGAPSWVRFLPLIPALGVEGIRFRNVEGQEASIGAESVVDTRRCTVIVACGKRFSTVEHLMSALSGCGITDAVVEFDGPEAPILDGSALEFVRSIREAGIEDLPGALDPIVVQTPIDIVGASGERIIAAPFDGFSLTAVIDYPDRPAIGTQAATYSPDCDYELMVAPARTYGFLSELEHVRALGLATGASLDNCIALNDDGSADERTPLRFDNELARHKLLDAIGDLALAGRPIRALVVALRPSHAVNSALTRRLAALA